MKNALIVGIVSLLATSISQAQLTGTLDQVISPVRPIIDRAPSDLNTIREQARQKLQSSVKDAGELSTLSVDILDSIPTPRFTVPAAKTILSASGQKIIDEIVVENGFLAVEKEWLFLGEEADKVHFHNTHFTIVKAQYLPAFSQWLFKVKVTGNEDEVLHIRNSLPEKLQSQIGRNHIYLSQSGNEINERETKLKQQITAPTHKLRSQVCSIPLRIGMVDTHVSPTHPSLSHLTLSQASFIKGQQLDGNTPGNVDDSKALINTSNTQYESAPFSSEHGTAVASLLAASLPQSSQLFNASVFYSRNSISQGATLMSLIEGLNYLASQHVDAINMSLAGPDNPILARIIKQLDKQGIQIIAAVGNEGPASLPLYPAAYPETLGITAVDNAHVIYRWANQGDHVDFAALGVSVDVAHPNGKTVRQTGTSMASPRATALYACFLREEKGRNSALVALKQSAFDAGSPGRDRVFGFGILP